MGFREWAVAIGVTCFASLCVLLYYEESSSDFVRVIPVTIGPEGPARELSLVDTRNVVHVLDRSFKVRYQGEPVPLVLRQGGKTTETWYFDPGKHALVLLPESWIVSKGAYRGRRVRTDLLVSLNGGSPSLLTLPFEVWRRFPVDVAVKPAGTRPMSVEVLMEAIHGINEMAGFRVFSDPHIYSGDRGLRAVTIEWANLGAKSLGQATIESERCRGAQDLALCDNRTGGRKDVLEWIYRSRIVLSSSADVSDIQHELLHSLGIGHTCVVPSVMATEFSEADLQACADRRRGAGIVTPLTLERTLSAYDAAAIQLIASFSDGLGKTKPDFVHCIERRQ